jgi:hypothetical protein
MTAAHDPVVTRVTEALERKRAITFGDESPDNEFPEIKWQCYGLIDSNEVAVIARCGDLQLGICRESYLLHPPMADRIFGMDVADDQLVAELSEELWNQRHEQLSAAALQIRSAPQA